MEKLDIQVNSDFAKDKLNILWSRIRFYSMMGVREFSMDAILDKTFLQDRENDRWMKEFIIR